jgi:hypothetical protein
VAEAYILGKGGHAKVVSRCLYGSYGRLPMLGPDDPVPECGVLAIGVGNLEQRRILFEQFTGSHYITGCRHSTVWTCRYPWPLDHMGIQLMAGVIIQPGTTIGVNVLVNTGAQVDHDCKIGPHCVIGPGAIICGGVTLGEDCAIGAGATVLEGMTIDTGTKIPAGTLVAGPDDLRFPQAAASA